MLTLEACLALRDVFEYERSDGDFYYLRRGKWKGPVSEFYISDYLNETPEEEVSCPDALDALDWLADAEQHPRWRYIWQSDTVSEPDGTITRYWNAQEGRTLRYVAEAPDPSALIVTVAEWHQRQQEAT